MNRIKKNDMAIVVAGNDSGKTGKVLRLVPKGNKIVVEGMNLVHKHVRRSQQNPQGGRLSKEMPISVSNVMLVDPTTDQPTRVGVRILEDGSKERYSKSSGAAMGLIAPAKKSK